MADPTDVSGLVHWWRADSVTGVAEGGQVASVPPRAGSLTLAHETASMRPAYRGAGIGGQPALEFDGTADHLWTPNYTQNATATYFVVHHPRAGTDFGQIFHAGQEMFWDQANRMGLWSSGGGFTVSRTIPRTAKVWTGLFNGSSSAVLVDGTVVGTGTTGDAVSSRAFTLARYNTASRWYPGMIADVIIYNRALSSAEMATVHTYIQDRYGITVADYVPSGPSEGVASGAWSFAGSASGETPALPTEGESSGFWSFSGAAAGEAPGPTGPYPADTLYPSSTLYPGVPVPGEGDATGSWSFTGAASGATARRGDATGTWTYAGSATGATARRGAATGAATWAGTASGVSVRTGTATGATAWVATATGLAPLGSMALGSWAFTGTAEGRTDRAGTATGTTAWTGAATASNARTGTASGATAWAGTATGDAPRYAAAVGGWTFTGTANGLTVRAGSAVGAVAWTGLAFGATTVRDIRITAEITARALAGQLTPRTLDGDLAPRTLTGTATPRRVTTALTPRRLTATVED